MAAIQATGVAAALSSSFSSQPCAAPSSSSLKWQGACLPACLKSKFSGPAFEQKPRRVRAAALAEDETTAQATEVEEAAYEEGELVGNDELLLYFKAEGTLSEAAIPRVTKALEVLEGVENVRVTVLEGCATAECTKTTTVQAAAASSSLVEALQGAGFSLQTVSLGFNDDGSETAEGLFAVYTAEGSDILAESQSLGD